MERFWEGLWEVKFTRRQGFRAGLILAGGIAAGGCRPASQEVSQTFKKEGGVGILTTNGKDGRYDRRFEKDKLRRPQITDKINLPGSDLNLTLLFSPGLLDESVDVVAQILKGDSNPDSVWDRSFPADLNTNNGIVVFWKDLKLERKATWNGKDYCFDTPDNRCNSVALTIE